MIKRYCNGHLLYPDNETYIPGLCKIIYNKKSFYKARAYLVLSLRMGHLAHADNKKWHVGTFHCNTLEHEREDHVYSLKAVNPGRIDTFENLEEEKVIIEVEATHVSDIKFDAEFPDKSLSKPKIKRIDRNEIE